MVKLISCRVVTRKFILLILTIYIIRNKQQGLAILRKERREINQKIMPLLSWNMYLFQNKKRTVTEIINIETPINNINSEFNKGWMNISN